jgi:hypothetical protein
MQQKMKPRLMLWLIVSLFLSACGAEEPARIPRISVVPAPSPVAVNAAGAKGQPPARPEENTVGKADEQGIDVRLAGAIEKMATDRKSASQFRGCVAAFAKPKASSSESGTASQVGRPGYAEPSESALFSKEELNEVLMQMRAFLTILVQDSNSGPFLMAISDLKSGRPPLAPLLYFLLVEKMNRIAFDVTKAQFDINKEFDEAKAKSWVPNWPSFSAFHGWSNGVLAFQTWGVAVSASCMWNLSIPLGIGLIYGSHKIAEMMHMLNLPKATERRILEIGRKAQTKVANYVPAIASAPDTSELLEEKISKLAQAALALKSEQSGQSTHLFGKLKSSWSFFAYGSDGLPNEATPAQIEHRRQVKKWLYSKFDSKSRDANGPMGCLLEKHGIGHLIFGGKDVGPSTLTKDHVEKLHAFVNELIRL